MNRSRGPGTDTTHIRATHGRRDNERRLLGFPAVFKVESVRSKVLATRLQELWVQNDPLKISRI